jgi:tetratricopeptide (TPR) repeat protein
MTADLDDLFFLSSILIKAGRYSDSISCFDEIVVLKPSLTRRNCHLLEDAFKKAIDPIRTTLCQLMAFYDAEVDEGHALRAEMIQLHKERAHAELEALCHRAISIIKTSLVPIPQSPFGIVFLLRSLGDYYRYLTEFESGTELQIALKEAEANYQKAVEMADTNLLKSDPMRLMAINHLAIFKYDHLKAVGEACELLQKARIDAEMDLAELEEEQKREALLTLEIMETNLVVWFADDNKS